MDVTHFVGAIYVLRLQFVYVTLLHIALLILLLRLLRYDYVALQDLILVTFTLVITPRLR